MGDGRRRRLDLELVRRGLAPTRSRAQADIDAGRVMVGGAPADKAARLVAPAEPVVVSGPPPPFVSRGGHKLAAALERFGAEPRQRTALDAGASTGGFTDCLLQGGAAAVFAVDVGYGQLDVRLRADSRVRVMERTNVRNLTPADLGGARPSLVVADLSFISLRSVASALLGLASPGADLILLVKPQFEAGRAVVSDGKGVVKRPEVWADVLGVVAARYQAGGATMMGLMPSPLRGADGNVEFLVHLVSPDPVRLPTPSPGDGRPMIAAAVADAADRWVTP